MKAPAKIMSECYTTELKCQNGQFWTKNHLPSVTIEKLGYLKNAIPPKRTEPQNTFKARQPVS